MKRVFVSSANFNREVERKKQKDQRVEERRIEKSPPSSNSSDDVDVVTVDHEISVLERCYLELIAKNVNKMYFDRCGCDITHEERIELFIEDAVEQIKSDSTELYENFCNDIKNSLPLYDITIVANIKKMLKCNVHIRKICNDNFDFFKEKLLEY